MRKVAEERRERRKKGNKKNGKKKKKKKSNDEIVFVGVHCRLTDHQVRHSPKSSISRFFTIICLLQALQSEKGMIPLRPSYFLKAMDMYREKYGEDGVAFVFISDDPDWARENLMHRVKQRDLFIVSSGDVEGVDR